jgi:hypothetical protein
MQASGQQRERNVGLDTAIPAQFATGTGSPLVAMPTVVRTPRARYVGEEKNSGAKIQARCFPA